MFLIILSLNWILQALLYSNYFHNICSGKVIEYLIHGISSFTIIIIIEQVEEAIWN